MADIPTGGADFYRRQHPVLARPGQRGGPWPVICADFRDEGAAGHDRPLDVQLTRGPRHSRARPLLHEIPVARRWHAGVAIWAPDDSVGAPPTATPMP